MAQIVEAVGGLTAVLFISCCVAIGPFVLPDGKQVDLFQYSFLNWLTLPGPSQSR